MSQLRPLGIAIGAGLASALLFAASTRGVGVGFLFAYVAPLPIMIATLGFGHTSGLVAATAAFGCISLVLGIVPGVVFASLLGFPSWWLGYLALLGRPLVPGPNAPVQSAKLMLWYPIGRVAAWAAGIVAAVILVIGAALMAHFGGFAATLSQIAVRLDDAIGQTTSGEALGVGTARTIVQLLPVMMAASAFLMLMVNLWLAGRVVERSALLSRPWPAVPENLRLPKTMAAVLACAGLVALFHGAPRVAGGVVIASLGLAFALQGLGTAHVLTRGLAARRIILFAIYFITFTIVPSVVALSVLGIVDCLFPMRQRQRPLPPSPTKS